MIVPRLTLRELQHRPFSFAAGVAWVALAVATCLIVAALHSAAVQETTRVQRDLGFNLRIIPAASDADSFLLQGYADETMPEEIVHRLANHKTLAYNHLVATLHGKVELASKPALLTGLSPTLFPPGSKKPPMSPTIDEGTAHLGSKIAHRLGVKKGDHFQLADQSVEVARVAPESGTQDDLRVWVPLEMAQRILGKQGDINEIQAIDCLCLSPEENPRELLQREIGKIAPEAQVVMLEKLATARARQRQMITKLASAAIPIVVLAGAAGLALLSWLNVRGRTSEIGLLRVLGHSSATIAALVFGKAALTGLLGAALGISIAYLTASDWVAKLYPVTGGKYEFDTALAWQALALAPFIACAAAALAASLAVTQDPSVVLRDAQ